MSRRVIAHMVVRNEAQRYLEVVLHALVPLVEAIHVYDDLSSDDTVALALDNGARVTRRPPLVPSWAVDEGGFRQGAWRAMEEEMRPCPGDWILAIDADEILVASVPLAWAIDAAEAAGACAVVIPIPEVFELIPAAHHFGHALPMVRVDGFWKDLSAPRLVAYQEGGTFKRQRLACGSVPQYALSGQHLTGALDIELLHLGYATLEDRWDKYRRYAGAPGHNPAHIESILKTPWLVPWHGGTMAVWRGRRG